MAPIAPIKPDEVVKQKQEVIPDEVFEAFNFFIVQNFTGNCATVKQEDVVQRLAKDKDEVCTRKRIFENHWLDVEDIYRAAGWKVEYDKPGFNESYSAVFTFTVKRK